MRRKDREMDREFGYKLIDQVHYGVLSTVDENQEPYGLPLSIVREEDILYFHSAMDGRKVKILEKSPKVSIAFIGKVNVPEEYSKEELDEIAKDPSKASALISKVFTTEFESAIVVGQAKLMEDRETRIHALRLICEKYTPTKMDYFPLAIKSGLDRTNVYSIEIEEITAKSKKL